MRHCASLFRIIYLILKILDKIFNHHSHHALHVVLSLCSADKWSQGRARSVIYQPRPTGAPQKPPSRHTIYTIYLQYLLAGYLHRRRAPLLRHRATLPCHCLSVLWLAEYWEPGGKLLSSDSTFIQELTFVIRIKNNDTQP